MSHTQTSKAATQLMQRLTSIISELDEHAEYLRQNATLVREIKREGHECAFIKFRAAIEAEIAFVAKNMGDEREEALGSTNTGYLSAIWAAAKGSSNVVGIHRSLYGKGGLSHYKRGDNHTLHGRVDIVANGGDEWVKVIYTHEKKFFNEMASMGLFDDSSGDEDDLPIAEDDDPNTFLKTIQNVVEAAKYSRIRGQRPRIRLLLPRIQRGSSKEVDAVLDKVAALGVNVWTENDIPPELPLSEAKHDFFPKKSSILTSTINVDINTACTMVSDICHRGDIELLYHYHAQLRAWIVEEQEAPLMMSQIWPACGNKSLVCTREAKDRALKLAHEIGTDQELARTELLFDDTSLSMSREERISAFQKLSVWPVPKDWSLPIRVIDVDIETLKSSLPPVASTLCKTMTDHLHQSVFMYGWLSGATTLTSHVTLVKKMNRFLDEAWESGDLDARGPPVWVVQSCRGLFGKSEQKRLCKKFRTDGEALTDSKAFGNMDEAMEICVD
ncbi:hypothetical protein PVAG01_04926 [Phlyctema vagabunda]|uniref:DUF5614 domain-containing protein n=1 Tax=Phlyctema vagabunda TaxID=108571 RepID=A0ABR4PIQ0_9HELO